MSQNTVDPRESFPATTSKATTEEDVRVSNLLPPDFFKYEELEGDALNKRRATLELKLIAAFENHDSPLVYFGSAGSLNISTSELRVQAARTVADLITNVENVWPRERRLSQERADKATKEAAEAAKEDQKKADEGTAAQPTSLAREPDPNLRTTQPAQNLDFLLRTVGKEEVLGDDKTTSSAPGKSAQNESPPRQEIKSPATGPAKK